MVTTHIFDDLYGTSSFIIDDLGQLISATGLLVDFMIT
jgi:hypothetical protein